MASQQLASYLEGEETIRSECEAVVSAHANEKTVTVGLTDRRLLYVAEDGEAVHVDLGAISTVRSRPYTTRSYRGRDPRLLLAGGGVPVALGVVIVAVAATDPFALPFFLVIVGAVLGAEYLRTRPERVSWGDLPIDPPDAAAGLSDVATLDQFDVHDAAIGAMIGLAAIAATGMAVLASNRLVIISVPLGAGGALLLGYAHRHRGEFTGIEVVQREETEVSLTTVDGWSVTLTCPSDAGIEHDLAQLAATNAHGSPVASTG